MSTGEWIKLITIPFFTGAIAWLINWTALIMLFNPIASTAGRSRACTSSLASCLESFRRFPE